MNCKSDYHLTEADEPIPEMNSRNWTKPHKVKSLATHNSALGEAATIDIGNIHKNKTEQNQSFHDNAYDYPKR